MTLALILLATKYMMPGKFIVFEGGEKSGKTTQLNLLYEYLKSKNIDVVLTREPGGKNSPIAEKIREIILDKNHKELDVRAEVLLFLAARAQHVHEVVQPSLAAGKLVLCDRFDGSTFAYQGAARNIDFKKWLLKINYWAKYGMEPDLVVYLDIDPNIAMDRERLMKVDRLDSENMQFHKLVRMGFLEQAKKNKNWVTINANGTIEEVALQIKRAIDKMLE